ncbi:hypothetical protein WOLCODRAFT_159079 [Wolfiporia cocos MD-104 SS10]|uniref:Uncharacterized protein n=1 Tax=Wolfiporia cocos (strain MD-104) TaxID=742152 RepID=A0A2H3JI20_WOLCO|nr:hypothetical protein WOLCODRAFT_159079 [Wolfiporia cocos MD-104 SS10]
MPADRYQESVKKVEAQLPPPNKQVVTNVATGKPELWDIPSWSVKKVKDLVPNHKYRGPSWNPAAPWRSIVVKHTEEERKQLLEQRYEEYDRLREAAERHRALRTSERRLESAAEQSYLDKVVTNYPGYHPTPVMPASLLDRVISKETAARIAKEVRIESEWVADHFHLLPNDTEHDLITIMYKKYKWALRLLPILEETKRILGKLYVLILDDPSPFYQEPASQAVMSQNSRSTSPVVTPGMEARNPTTQPNPLGLINTIRISRVAPPIPFVTLQAETNVVDKTFPPVPVGPLPKSVTLPGAYGPYQQLIRDRIMEIEYPALDAAYPRLLRGIPEEEQPRLGNEVSIGYNAIMEAADVAAALAEEAQRKLASRLDSRFSTLFKRRRKGNRPSEEDTAELPEKEIIKVNSIWDTPVDILGEGGPNNPLISWLESLVDEETTMLTQLVAEIFEKDFEEAEDSEEPEPIDIKKWKSLVPEQYHEFIPTVFSQKASERMPERKPLTR